jgi:hypothetical protein
MPGGGQRLGAGHGQGAAMGSRCLSHTSPARWGRRQQLGEARGFRTWTAHRASCTSRQRRVADQLQPAGRGSKRVPLTSLLARGGQAQGPGQDHRPWQGPRPTYQGDHYLQHVVEDDVDGGLLHRHGHPRAARHERKHQGPGPGEPRADGPERPVAPQQLVALVPADCSGTGAARGEGRRGGPGRRLGPCLASPRRAVVRGLAGCAAGGRLGAPAPRRGAGRSGVMAGSRGGGGGGGRGGGP